MKKLIATVAFFAFAIVAGVNTMAQQGEWAGIVKYKLEWKGNVPQGVPGEWETKIYKNLEGTDLMQAFSGAKSIHNSDKNSVIAMFDFSMIPDEGIYEGMQGKWYIKQNIDVAKLKENTTYEFTGETKDIAGIKCEKVNVTFKGGEDEKEQKETIWVTKELGPKTCLTYYPGLNAFPMEFPIQFSEEISLNMVAQEVKKGKVSQADLMLEDGYEEISEEDFQEWMQRLQNAQQGAGASEDDM